MLSIDRKSGRGLLLLTCINMGKQSALTCKMPDFARSRFNQINSESASKLFDSLVLLSESDVRKKLACL